jgi:hypothetical protein
MQRKVKHKFNARCFGRKGLGKTKYFNYIVKSMDKAWSNSSGGFPWSWVEKSPYMCFLPDCFFKDKGASTILWI